jgi:hypothetical protein
MNSFLPTQYVEHVERMALGLEPIDALRGERVATSLAIAIDGAPDVDAESAWPDGVLFPDPIGHLRRIARHNSCRYVLLYRPGMKTTINLRFFDRYRRFAPRRISYTLPPDINTPSPRVRRPALFPGAGYDVSQSVTGMRGRVTWNQSMVDEVPARWVRVQASINGQIVGRAHGDDRGEFLLLLDSRAGGQGDLPEPLDVVVTVFGPPAPQQIPAGDPLGDLPLEVVLADPDDVSPGVKLPTNPPYQSTAQSSRTVTFQLGTILTGQQKFFLSA